MKILCIDPGPEYSGVVIMDGKTILEIYPKVANNTILEDIFVFCDAKMMVIEMIASYGMSVGQSVFETCVWIGRFEQAFGERPTEMCQIRRIYRKDVKMYLCNSMQAKDTNIRRAILDMYPETGGGKTPQIGTEKKPGPLYGVSKHAWAALAVGLTFLDVAKKQ